MPAHMVVTEGDITIQAVDAIVNAAKEGLLAGGGVDGAINWAAGPGLLTECRALGCCPMGDARITGGHGLCADCVIHAVGPIWRGGGAGEDELLAACYRNALARARGAWGAEHRFPGHLHRGLPVPARARRCHRGGDRGQRARWRRGHRPGRLRVLRRRGQGRLRRGARGAD